MTAPVDPSNETNEVRRTTPAPPPRSPHRTFPFSVPVRSLFPSLPLSALVLFLCLLASAENPKVYSGQTITNVAVTLVGPEERLLVLPGDTNPPTYAYAANGSYDATGEIEDESVELPVLETYTWDVDEEVVEIVSGGGASDKSITIRFRTGQHSDTVVSVIYAVTVNGVSREDWVASTSLVVIARKVRLELTNAFADDGLTYKIDTGTAEFLATVLVGGASATDYEWVFGDDETATTTTATTQHVYPFVESYNAKVRVTVGGEVLESNEITVDLDYSNVYPVEFTAGENLDFPEHVPWLAARLARLVPATGVNALEIDVLQNGDFLDVDLESYDLTFSEGWDPAFYSQSFDCSVFGVSSPPDRAEASPSPEAAFGIRPARAEGGDAMGLGGAIGKLKTLLQKQKAALEELAGVEWYAELNERASKLASSLNALEIRYNMFTGDMTLANFQGFLSSLSAVAKNAGELTDHMKKLTQEINQKAKKYHLPESTKLLVLAVDDASLAFSGVQEVIGQVKDIIDPLSEFGDGIENAFRRFEGNVLLHYNPYFDGYLPSPNPPPWVANVPGVNASVPFMQQTLEVRQMLVFSAMDELIVPPTLAGIGVQVVHDAKGAGQFVLQAGFEGLTLWEKLFSPKKRIEKAVKAIHTIKATIDVMRQLRREQ